MSTITKNELVQQVMQDSEFKRHMAIKFVDDFFEVIIRNLEQGEEVKVPRFGNFILRDKAARLGRNPKTKEEHTISGRRVVSFRTSSMLRAALKTK